MCAVHPETDEQHRRYVNNLTDEHRLLLRIRRDLYADCDDPWGEMLEDMRKRCHGKLCTGLSFEVNEDMRRIDELREYETAHNVNLADYLPDI